MDVGGEDRVILEKESTFQIQNKTRRQTKLANEDRTILGAENAFQIQTRNGTNKIFNEDRTIF